MNCRQRLISSKMKQKPWPSLCWITHSETQSNQNYSHSFKTHHNIMMYKIFFPPICCLDSCLNLLLSLRGGVWLKTELFVIWFTKVASQLRDYAECKKQVRTPPELERRKVWSQNQTVSPEGAIDAKMRQFSKGLPEDACLSTAGRTRAQQSPTNRSGFSRDSATPFPVQKAALHLDISFKVC